MLLTAKIFSHASLSISPRALSREQKPDDLVGTALYMLSDLAGFVSGQTIVVDGGVRSQARHPTLQTILDTLSETFIVELQAQPSIQPQDLTAFMKSTSPAADPYGWGVLQRFGLSIAFAASSFFLSFFQFGGGALV